MNGVRNTLLCIVLGAIALSSTFAQDATSGRVIVNPKTAKWESKSGDIENASSVVLREDAATGSLELFARYPAGHVFAPHWHSANERLILIEGRLSIRNGGGAEQFLEPGGYAFMPAKEVQRLACVSQTRCSFYLYWDGKVDFNPVKEQ